MLARFAGGTCQSRRSEVRFAIERKVSCHTCLGQVVDVSSGGMKLLLPRRTELGETLAVTCLDRTGPRKVLCRVVWSSEGATGVRFCDSSEATEAWFRSMVFEEDLKVEAGVPDKLYVRARSEVTALPKRQPRQRRIRLLPSAEKAVLN